MYGLPDNLDLSRFVGCTLESITFSQNTVHFVFDHDVSITVEASFLHTITHPSIQDQRADVPVSESQAMSLIGQAVTVARGAPDGTLTLTFGNGHALSFYDDSTTYESYHVRFGGEEFTI